MYLLLYMRKFIRIEPIKGLEILFISAILCVDINLKFN